jgi:hypothetical protein
MTIGMHSMFPHRYYAAYCLFHPSRRVIAGLNNSCHSNAFSWAIVAFLVLSTSTNISTRNLDQGKKRRFFFTIRRLVPFQIESPCSYNWCLSSSTASKLKHYLERWQGSEIISVAYIIFITRDSSLWGLTGHFCKRRVQLDRSRKPSGFLFPL